MAKTEAPKGDLSSLIAAVQAEPPGTTVVGGKPLVAALRLGRAGIPQAEACQKQLADLAPRVRSRIGTLLLVAKGVRRQTQVRPARS